MKQNWGESEETGTGDVIKQLEPPARGKVSDEGNLASRRPQNGDADDQLVRAVRRSFIHSHPVIILSLVLDEVTKHFRDRFRFTRHSFLMFV